MAGGEDVNMIESSKSKLDNIMNALNALTIRTTKIEGFFAKIHGDTRSGAPQPTVQPSSHASASKEVVIPAAQTLPTQQSKEPQVSVPGKLDGTRSKFRGFVNQIRLVIFLQPECYPIEESQVGLVETVLARQALC